MDVKKRQIFHIITGLHDGGAEAVVSRLCLHDAANRHHVVSLMDGGKYGPLLQQRGIAVTCLNMPQGRVTPSGVGRLWHLLRRARPEVVQTWLYHGDLIGGVVAKLAGVRRVFWGIRHGALDPNFTKGTTLWAARLCAWLSGWVPTKIVCCAQRALETHQELGYQASKLLVIPNGYDVRRFCSDTEARDRLRADWAMNEMVVVGMVGRFDPLKDHENLLNALSFVKQTGRRFRCVLVGRGCEASNQELSEWITKYSLNEEMILLGQRTDIPAVMNALDVHVLSSRTEAFPNVLAEAMACGTPCVTTDVGDAALIVGETGWVVPPSDSGALAKAIQEALDEPLTERQTRGQAARERIVANFSLERMVEAYHKVWGMEKRSETGILNEESRINN